MSIYDFIWDRALKHVSPGRRSGRETATAASRIALLEREVSELEVVCKTLIAVVREARVMTDDRVDVLLRSVVDKAARAPDTAGEQLSR